MDGYLDRCVDRKIDGKICIVDGKIDG